MPLREEPLTADNLDEVVAFFRAANPFAQHNWGWDTGRFIDWRWGHNTNTEAARPGWFSEHCRVYRDGSTIRAVSVAEYGAEAECVITPGEDTVALAGVVARILERHAAAGTGLRFDCAGEAVWLSDVMTGAGFVEEPVTGHEWEFDLTGRHDPPGAADGFAIGPAAGDGDHDGINECLQRAFGSEYDFRPGLRSLESGPLSDRRLSVVARSPDGRIAAYCRGTVDPGNGVSGIDPVCTHPDFHRLGLGRAVVEACFAAQRELGGRRSYIGSGPEPAPGTFLYRSLGPSGRSDTSTWSLP